MSFGLSLQNVVHAATARSAGQGESLPPSTISPFPSSFSASKTATPPSSTESVYVFKLVFSLIRNSATPPDQPAAFGGSQSCTPLLAASLSNNEIMLYDAFGPSFHVPSYGRLIGHTDVIRDLMFVPSHPHLLLSASSDKTIRCWNVMTRTLVWTIQTPEEVFALAMGGPGGCILAGGVASDVWLWDVTFSPPKYQAIYTDLHTDLITTLSFSAADTNMLMSSSLDGLVCRANIVEEDVDDALESIINVEQPVSGAGLFGRTRSFMFTLTIVETFSVWNADTDVRLLDLPNIRQDAARAQIPCDYVIGGHYRLLDDRLYLLCASFGGNIGILRVGEDGVTPVQVLSGGHSGVVRSFIWLEEGEGSLRIFTSGEDGRICLWGLSDLAPGGNSNTTHPNVGKMERGRRQSPY